MLTANGKPDRARRNILLCQFLIRQLTVRRRRRMNHQALHIRYICQQREQLQIITELLRRLAPTLDLDREDRRAAIGEIALIQRMIRMIRQGRMINLAHLLMSVQEFKAEDPIGIAERYAEDLGRVFDNDMRQLFNETLAAIRDEERM